METVRIQNGQTEKITVAFFDKSDPPAALTGETIPISIWRESDNEWFTGAAWQAGYTTFNISEFAQGIYYYNFNTAGLSDDVYHIRATCSNSDCVNPIQAGELKVGYYVDNLNATVSSRSSHSAAGVWAVATRTLTTFGTLVADIWSYATRVLTAIGSSGISSQSSIDSIQTDINRLLGLSNENTHIDQTSYDANNNLTSARIRIYSDSASVGTDSNVIATYTVTAVASGQGKFTSWEQVKS